MFTYSMMVQRQMYLQTTWNKLTAIGATVTFTATPVNTQGTEVNAPNESK